jgi:hypothetical protein
VAKYSRFDPRNKKKEKDKRKVWEKPKPINNNLSMEFRDPKLDWSKPTR